MSAVQEAGQGARLFLALWPDERVRRALVAARDQLLPHTGGTPMVPANLHLTLAFLGNTAENRKAALVERMALIRAAPVRITLDQYGVWAPPGVAWLGPTQVPSSLLELVKAIQAGLREVQLPVERRAYQAHVTLARKAKRAVRLPLVAPVHWFAQDFVLVRSVSMPSGVRYEVIARWPLLPADAD